MITRRRSRRSSSGGHIRCADLPNHMTTMQLCNFSSCPTPVIAVINILCFLSPTRRFFLSAFLRLATSSIASAAAAAGDQGVYLYFSSLHCSNSHLSHLHRAPKCNCKDHFLWVRDKISEDLTHEKFLLFRAFYFVIINNYMQLNW